jgi:hypothetical protein
MNTAATAIGPGTIEQLTTEVVRLSRAYVAGPPLPLFTAMHQPGFFTGVTGSSP